MKTGIQIEKVKEVLKDTPFNRYEIHNIKEGVSTDVFKLTDTDTYYLKILPKEDSLPAISHTNKLLLDLGVNVARIEYTSENNSAFDDRSFYIEKELKGKSLKEDNILSKEQKEKIIYEAGKELAKINSIVVQGVGWINGVTDGQIYSKGKNYSDFILNNIDNMLGELANDNVLSDNQTEKIREYINNNQPLIDTNNTSYLSHGDLDVGHIYHIDGIYSGIIDFGDIRGASKYHDLAHFYTFNKEYFSSLLEGYISGYSLAPNHMDSIKIEAIIFGVSKLWWISKNRLEKLNHHPTLKLFEEVIFFEEKGGSKK